MEVAHVLDLRQLHDLLERELQRLLHGAVDDQLPLRQLDVRLTSEVEDRPPLGDGLPDRHPRHPVAIRLSVPFGRPGARLLHLAEEALAQLHSRFDDPRLFFVHGI